MRGAVVLPFSPTGPTPRQAAINAFLELSDQLPARSFCALREASYELLQQLDPDGTAALALAVLLDEISDALRSTERTETTQPGTTATP